MTYLRNDYSGTDLLQGGENKSNWYLYLTGEKTNSLWPNGKGNCVKPTEVSARIIKE